MLNQQSRPATHVTPGFRPKAARRRFPVSLLFGMILLVSDSMMAVVEFSTVGVACIASIILAMCLFPVGVLLQRYGETQDSWLHAIAVSAGLCTLVAIPTSFGTLIPGAVAIVSQLASKARASHDDVIDVDVEN